MTYPAILTSIPRFFSIIATKMSTISNSSSVMLPVDHSLKRLQIDVWIKKKKKNLFKTHYWFPVQNVYRKELCWVCVILYGSGNTCFPHLPSLSTWVWWSALIHIVGVKAPVPSRKSPKASVRISFDSPWRNSGLWLSQCCTYLTAVKQMKCSNETINTWPL